MHFGIGKSRDVLWRVVSVQHDRTRHVTWRANWNLSFRKLWRLKLVRFWVVTWWTFSLFTLFFIFYFDFRWFSAYSVSYVLRLFSSIDVRITVDVIASSSPSNASFVVSSFGRWRCSRQRRCSRCANPPGSGSPVRPLRYAYLEWSGSARGISGYRVHRLLERACFRQVSLSVLAVNFFDGILCFSSILL